jgi:hypothetical protein
MNPIVPAATATATMRIQIRRWRAAGVEPREGAWRLVPVVVVTTEL